MYDNFLFIYGTTDYQIIGPTVYCWPNRAIATLYNKFRNSVCVIQATYVQLYV